MKSKKSFTNKSIKKDKVYGCYIGCGWTCNICHPDLIYHSVYKSKIKLSNKDKLKIKHERFDEL